MKIKIKKALYFIYYATICIAVFCNVLVVLSPAIAIFLAPFAGVYYYNNWWYLLWNLITFPLCFGLFYEVYMFFKE